MSKHLELQFITGEGKNKTLTIADPADNLTVEVIETAMNTISEQNLFEDKGTNLYQDVKGARYVTRIVDEVFNVDSEEIN